MSVKKAAAAFGFSLVSFLLGLAALEAGCRWYFSRNLDYQVEMSRYAARLKQRSPDPEMSHQHVPDRSATLMGVPVTINSQGFRDGEYALEKPEGVYRILLLGDSLTFGWGVEADSRFSDILERRLNSEHAGTQRAERFEVINTGIGNYNTSQETAFFRTSGRSWKPDTVIVNYFINDAEPTPVKRAPALFRHSYLGMLLWGRIDILARRFGGRASFADYYEGLYDDSAPGWEEARQAMGTLAGLAEQDGFRLCMFLLPELHAVGPRYLFTGVHAKVAAAAREKGLTAVFDLAGAFSGETPESLWVSLDDAHPNEKAHAILANAMYGHLTASCLE